MKQLTVIGSNHGKKVSRIWIEGKRLVDHGFKVGAQYVREVDRKAGIISLTLCAKGQVGTHKVSGKNDKPIIDTSGAVVREVFPPMDGDLKKQMVEVEYEQGRITMRQAKEEVDAG